MTEWEPYVPVGPGTCSLMPGVLPPGHCHWCGGELTGKQKKWCSRKCSSDFLANHDWTMARERRVATDGGVCARCGVQCRSRYWNGWKQHPEYPVEHRLSWEELQKLPLAWRRRALVQYEDALKAFNKKFALPVSPEVNHVDPRVGRGYSFGCWNHQDKLETVCHKCHVKITKDQRTARRMAEAARVAEEERGRRRSNQGPGEGDGTPAQA